jgi:hypothetical protein
MGRHSLSTTHSIYELSCLLDTKLFVKISVVIISDLTVSEPREMNWETMRKLKHRFSCHQLTMRED